MHGSGYVPPEESLGKIYDTKIFRRLYVFARPYVPYLLLALFVAAFLSGSDIILPYLTKIGIDRFIVIRGKHIDLTVLSPGEKERILEHYAGKFVFLKSHDALVIKEGLLDPLDRKALDKKNAIDTADYYLLDLARYDEEKKTAIEALIGTHSNMFLATDSPGKFFIRTRDIASLPGDFPGIVRHPDWLGVAGICGVYFLILLASFAAMFGQMVLMTWIGQRIMFDIRSRLFEHIESLPIRFFNKQPVGRLVTRVSNDVNVLNEVFTSILVDLFKNILKLVGIVVAMLLLAPALALVAFSVLPFIIVVTWYFKRKMRDAFREVRARIALINTMLSEHLSGMKVIQMFARERIHYEKFKENNHKCYQANMHQLVVKSMFSPFIVFLENLGIALILYYGGGQVVQNTISLGTLMAFLSYLTMFFGPVRDIAEKFNIMQSAMASSERIFQIFDKTPETHDETDVDPGKKSIRGHIEFKHVWFAYENDDWVLKDISFSVKPGQTIALVGATGSGKTTIVNLLTRFYEVQKGQILIDGVDIRRYPRRFLRKHIAMVLQDVFLFAGDIRKNIRLNNASISDSDIETVARITNAHTFIDRFPDRFEHVLEEGGATLSQGQRQLLSFARALAADPAILILDEATANIDSETEALIQEAMARLMTSRTSLVVAHRLSTIKKADIIIVLHRGKVMETGNHESLLARKGIYYRLYQLQYKYQEQQVERA